QVGDTYYLGQQGYVHFYGIGALAVRAGVYVYPVGAALVVDGQLLGGVAGAPGVLGAGVPCIQGQRPCFTVGGVQPAVYGYRAVADGGDVGGGGTADVPYGYGVGAGPGYGQGRGGGTGNVVAVELP